MIFEESFCFISFRPGKIYSRCTINTLNKLFVGFAKLLKPWNIRITLGMIVVLMQ